MPKQFLRGQALRLGLDDTGLKTDLVEQLVTHLSDQLGPDGLMALGPGAVPADLGDVRSLCPVVMLLSTRCSQMPHLLITNECSLALSQVPGRPAICFTACLCS